MTGQRRFIALFLAPAFLLVTGFVVLPAGSAVYLSLHAWDGFDAPSWAGFENYAALFETGSLFPRALAHNLILLAGAGGGILALSLTFAALLHRRVRGAALFRVAFFFPNVLAAVAVALLWVLLYSTTEFGVVNALLAKGEAGLRALGFDAVFGLPFPFLDSRYLIVSIIPMVIWTATGFYMVLFLAAMSGIPETYYEAASLEGATPWQQFRHVTFPLIRETLVVALIFLLITSLKLFDPIWVMENQRPTPDSHVLATLLYQKVFTEYNVGYGAAVAVMLFLMVFAATLVTLRLTRHERVEY